MRQWNERCAGSEQAAASVNAQANLCVSGHNVLPLLFHMLSTPAWTECDYVLACTYCVYWQSNIQSPDRLQPWWNTFWQDQLVLWQIRIVRHNDTALLLTKLRLLKPKLCLHTVSPTASWILNFCAKRLFWEPSETRSKSHLSVLLPAVMLPAAKYHNQYCVSTD